MPFKSKAQERFMFATHPQMAKEWAAHTPSQKGLPEHVHKPKSKLVQYFEGGGTVAEPQTEADRLAADAEKLKALEEVKQLNGQIETNLNPDFVPQYGGGIPDPSLAVDPAQMPARGPDRAPAMLTPGEEVIPPQPAQKAREGSYGPLIDYFKRKP